MKRPKQLTLLKREKSAYGGDLRKTRAGRIGARPLATRETMHLVLRSTMATGALSFRRPQHDRSVRRIVLKFAFAYGIRVISMANAGNNLHLQIKLASRPTYRPFIRAITGAIAMAITGRSRWTKRSPADPSRGIQSPTARRSGNASTAASENPSENLNTRKFWDYRPFTRIVQSFRGYLKLKDYIRINELEGYGHSRTDARFMITIEKQLATTR